MGGFSLSADLVNQLAWDAILKLADRLPQGKDFLYLLFGRGNMEITHRCTISGKEALIENQTGGAQGQGSTVVICALLLAPVQGLIHELFECGESTDLNLILSFCDDGHVASLDLDTAVAMVLFQLDNDPGFLPRK